ncbi:MAG TPA: acyl-CoA desaturase [Candidatus Peribacteraceae bacterium]|nr:acyl-CoA desaturase [Candidatus Peribacteraceae bacterium]
MKKINWTVTTGLAAIHGAALAGILFFTWEGLVICCILYMLTAGGVTVGYHRYLTHYGFETYRPIRWSLAVLGLLSGEGPPIYWVALHRKHHQYSDEEGDPHTPLNGYWHAHVLWLFGLSRVDNLGLLFRHYAKDLYGEPFMRLLNKAYLFLHLGMIVLLAGAGYAYGGRAYALSFVAYGFFIRMVCVLHSTWLVNSESHTRGYRNYDTADRSKNNWVVALLTGGEGWHNNHHAHPTLAVHGHKWWEFDPSYKLIKLLKFCGLAWNVKDKIPRSA